jgi:hypothetical protein
VSDSENPKTSPEVTKYTAWYGHRGTGRHRTGEAGGNPRTTVPACGISTMRISSMTVSDVLALLDAERDGRGTSNFGKPGLSTAG